MEGDTPEQGPEGGGPVHYQISITGKQAAVFFLMLLAAVGLSFFFGMKTGAAAKRGGDAVSTLAGASDLPVPKLPPDESAAARGEAAPAPTPTPEPAEKKLGFEDAAPAAAATPAPTRAPEPVKTRTEEKPAAKAPEKAAAPEKTPSHQKPAEKPAEKAATKTWHVQVFATKDGKKADDLVKKLKREGFRADVATSPKNPELFVVRVGPLGDKAKAEVQRKKLLRSNPGLKGLMVVPS